MEYNGADFMEYPKHKPVYSNVIPITWIEELSDKLKEEDNFEKAMFLLDMIDVWEKENGADRLR